MKRKQIYRVRVLHRATIDAVVEAENRDIAKKKALEKFHSAADMDSDFHNLPPTIHSLVCLGTAEKTKPRSANPYLHGCNPKAVKFGGK